jgi:hypothetical protein
MSTASKNNNSKAKKTRTEVQVVKCPSAFPISSKTKTTTGGSRKRPRDSPSSDDNNRAQNDNNNNSSKTKLLDWHDTAKEVRAYGATAFVGKTKRDYEDEQYYLLTGRHKKKQKVPLNIVQGIKKASAKRDTKMREEARKAGIVVPKAAKEQTKKKSSDTTYKNHGPAPSIGFMKHGVYRVSKKNKPSTTNTRNKK